MNNPLISVILPVFNGEKYVEQAVESVIAQEYEPLELIVVNDGSVDNTERVLEKYKGKIRYYYQQNKGVSAARNKGLEVAMGEFITFIDADDTWPPGKIDLHLSEFEKNDSIGISIGLSYKCIYEDLHEIEIEEAHRSASFHLLLGSSLTKKSMFDRVGFFDEDLLLGQDTDWFFRARELNVSIAVIKKVVLYYRKHENNRTNNKQLFNYYVFKVLKKAKDRKQNQSTDLNSYANKKPDSMEDLINLWHTVKI